MLEIIFRTSKTSKTSRMKVIPDLVSVLRS